LPQNYTFIGKNNADWADFLQ